MPVLKGQLRDEDEAKIRGNYIFLLRELDGDFLANYLYQANVFDIYDKQEISNQLSKTKKTELFLEKLLFSGPGRAYRVFLETLRQHSPHVAEKLEETPREDGALSTKELKKALPETKDDASTSRSIHDEVILNKIRRVFVQFIIPMNIIHVFHSYNDNVLTQQDIEVVTSVSANKRPSLGAGELLSRLVRYQGWFSCLLQVLRDPHVKQGHVADTMWRALGMGEEKTSEKEDSIDVVKNKLLTALVVLRDMTNVINEDGINCLKCMYQTWRDYPSYREDISDWLADHGLAETCMKILREVMTIGNIQDVNIWPVIVYTLRGVCLNYSGGPKFSKRLAESGAVQFMTDILRQQHYIDNLHRERERHVMTSCLAVLGNIARKVGRIPALKECKAVEVLMSLTDSNNVFIRVCAMMALVWIVEEEEMPTVTSDLVTTIIRWINKALNDTQSRSCEGFPAYTLTAYLARLAKSDGNKRKIVQAGGLEVFMLMLRHTDPDRYEQGWTAACLSYLAGDERIRQVIRDFPDMVQTLQNLRDSQYDNVRRWVGQALEVIGGHT